MNLFRSEFTDFYDFFYFGNDKITGESHRAVGSSGIQMEIEIAGCISFCCLNQGNVCMERHLKEIFLAVDCQFLLAVLNFRANTGRCQTAAKTGTAQLGDNQVNNAIFICYAPYDNPKVAVAVVVEHGSAGASIASIARGFLDAYFTVKTVDTAPESELSLLR